MRIFGRFLYALLSVGLFLLTYTYAIDLTANKFYEEVFGTSLTNQDSQLPDFYYFYTSIPDFHKKTPIISIDIDGYQIRGYEVAKTKINNNNELEVTEAIYLIVYSDNQDLSKLTHIQIYNSNNTEERKSISLTRFKTLNILNGVNDSQTIYLQKDLFLSYNFDKMSLVNTEGIVVSDSEFSISNSQFTIKDVLTDFYDENNKIPEKDNINELSTHDIGMKIIHLTENNKLDGNIMLIAMAIYFVILILATYLIFFKKRKYE